MDGANEVVGGVQDAAWVSPEALKRDLHCWWRGSPSRSWGRSTGRGRGS